MPKGNLLLVDDEPLLLKNMKISLMDLADEIYTAPDGVAALEVLATQKIHCVVCDINMPKMNGIEVIKRIRENQNEVPLIFYTGHGNGELMNEASRYGAFDFLNKPNFVGLEEVVGRGLKFGVGEKSEGDTDLEADLLSLLSDDEAA